MLRGIPHILSPELLKILCEMGHSDRIVIADGNFPAESMGRDAHVIHMEGKALAFPPGHLRGTSCLPDVGNGRGYG